MKVLSEDDGMLLLERAVPGISFKSYFSNMEQKSIEITCGVMKKLHQASIPEDHTFPHIKDWLEALDGDLGRVNTINQSQDMISFIYENIK